MSNLEARLPIEALNKAIASRHGALKDLIHHSGRGTHYACQDSADRTAPCDRI